MTPETQRGISFIFAPDGRLTAATCHSGAGAVLGVSATLTRPCVVPAGAPLFEHRSAVENVVLLASLTGRGYERATAVYWLRRVDVPDALHESAATSLPAMCRLRIWLAVVHLTVPEVVVLENPFGLLDAESTREFVSLLVEAAGRIPRVVVTGSDLSIARALSASKIPEFSRT